MGQQQHLGLESYAETPVLEYERVVSNVWQLKNLTGGAGVSVHQGEELFRVVERYWQKCTRYFVPRFTVAPLNPL